MRYLRRAEPGGGVSPGLHATIVVSALSAGTNCCRSQPVRPQLGWHFMIGAAWRHHMVLTIRGRGESFITFILLGLFVS
jgi:hypothetical protein